jgi:hypothetical protein
MNHILYKDGILKAKPFKRLPWVSQSIETWGWVRSVPAT